MLLSLPTPANDRIRPIPAAVGIGLRPEHHGWVIQNRPKVAWLEVHAETFMGHGARLSDLEAITRHYPLSLHAGGLSVGSIGRPDPDHLQQLQELVSRFEPDLVSDHLAWSAVGGTHLPDQLPLPYTEEALQVVARNVQRVQEQLEREILLENPARYARCVDSALSEAEFLAEVVLRTGCGVLLDIDNLYVSAVNCNQDPGAELEAFLSALPPECFGEIHLDGHGKPQIRALFERAIAALGALPTLIECDTNTPAFSALQAQAATAQALLDQVAEGGDCLAIAI